MTPPSFHRPTPFFQKKTDRDRYMELALSSPIKSHFTHETESPWPLHFKHSHWWKRRSHQSMSASHCTWGTNIVHVNARWMKMLHGLLHAIQWIMFHGHLDYFPKPSFGSKSNTKSGDHGIPNAHNRWFILFYHVWGSAWIKNHWKWHLVEGPVTCDFTLHSRIRDQTTWFWRCVGTAFGHFHLGSHNFMVTALGLCVKWP
jgi:hypothetical protein